MTAPQPDPTQMTASKRFLVLLVLALRLTSQSGAGSAPLVIVGVVATYLTTLALSTNKPATPADDPPPNGPVATPDQKRTVHA
jgi:hypothetical protein